MRSHKNIDLEALPDDETVIAAVADIVAENEAKMERARKDGYGYYADPAATANAVAHQLRLKGARRAGNGAVKGTWSGTMSAALRIAPRLRSLARKGRLVERHEDYRNVYEVALEEALADDVRRKRHGHA